MQKRLLLSLLPVLASTGIAFGVAGAAPAADPLNPDTVLAYPVPDALKLDNGQEVTDAKTWTRKRRPEILRTFTEEVYGETPKRKLPEHFQVDSVDEKALNGKAVRKEITISFSKDPGAPKIHVLLYIPVAAKGPVPVFVGLNFGGNQTVDADPGITLSKIWIVDPSDQTLPKDHRRHIAQEASPESRGQAAHSWQIEKIIDHGYGLATAYYGDIEPDFDGGMRYGVRALFLRTGQTAVAPNQWGAIGAWAWGMSRMVDYLDTDKSVDAKRIAIIGHSRIGKAALWAAAQDTRFALVISNESGKGGASLYRAKTGETIEHLNTAFPHWFCENFHRYSGHPDEAPVDGNLLLALIAPRPLYVASAEQDRTSNPEAEFLSAMLVGKVYRLFGEEGIGTDSMPPLDHAVMHSVGYHERTGKHDVTAFDWDQYLKFADMHFGTM